MENQVQVNLWMTQALKEALQQVAEDEDRSLSAVIRKACREYIEKYRD